MTSLRLIDLHILIHYGASSVHFTDEYPERASAPATRMSHELLYTAGLIQIYQGITHNDIMMSAEITDRGLAHLKALQHVELPRMLWISPGCKFEDGPKGD